MAKRAAPKKIPEAILNAQEMSIDDLKAKGVFHPDSVFGEDKTDLDEQDKVEKEQGMMGIDDELEKTKKMLSQPGADIPSGLRTPKPDDYGVMTRSQSASTVKVPMQLHKAAEALAKETKKQVSRNIDDKLKQQELSIPQQVATDAATQMINRVNFAISKSGMHTTSEETDQLLRYILTQPQFTDEQVLGYIAGYRQGVLKDLKRHEDEMAKYLENFAQLLKNLKEQSNTQTKHTSDLMTISSALKTHQISVKDPVLPQMPYSVPTGLGPAKSIPQGIKMLMGSSSNVEEPKPMESDDMDEVLKKADEILEELGDADFSYEYCMSMLRLREDDLLKFGPVVTVRKILTEEFAKLGKKKWAEILAIPKLLPQLKREIIKKLKERIMMIKPKP